MHFKTLLLLVAVVFSAIKAGAQQNLTAEFDRLVRAQYANPEAPGAAVLVAKKGEILYRNAVGLANLELGTALSPDQVFRIGSITKQFTAAAILQLAEQGKLSLDDEITRFLPDYPTQGERITIEHLLTHTSGIRSYTAMKEFDASVRRRDFSPLELIGFFKDQPMDFKPGTQWRYNNSGYIVLGYIIEKVSGQSYTQYVAENLFKPLGMHNSYYGAIEPVIKNRVAGYVQAGEKGPYANAPYWSMHIPYAAGALVSTVDDLYTWTRALHGGKVIGPESLKKATTPYRLADGSSSRYGYGLQLGYLFGSPTVEHTGGIPGFTTDMLYLPAEDVCVVVLTNCNCLPPGDLTARLAAVAIDQPLAPQPIAVAAGALEALVGVYENDKNEQRIITVENGRLYSQRTGGPRFALHAYAPDEFYFEGSFARIRFVREKGSVKAVRAVVSDRTATDHLWVRTDKPLPAARVEVQVPADQLEKLVGEYQLAPGFSITVTREGQRLFAQGTGQERAELFATSPTRFYFKVVDAEIEFYPDGTARAPRLVLFQGGREKEGKRL
jgi:CubicO group peptidase (beta-lactamase class C family)